MDVLIIMCLGVILGRFLNGAKTKKSVELLSLICTFLLIFSMGVMLGKKENFLQELSTLGVSSLIFFIVPTIFSIIIVYLLTKKIMNSKDSRKKEAK